MRNFVLFVVFLLNLGISMNAQIEKPVTWSFKSELVGTDEYNLIFTAKIDDGWAVYSQFLEEGGPVPTEFIYDDGSHFAKQGKTTETGNKIEMFDKVFEMDLAKFKKKGVFTQKVKVSDYSKPITGYLTFMTCDDEKCLPPTDVDFSFKLTPSSGAAEPAKTDTKVPAKATENKTANSNQKAANTTANAAKITATQPAAAEKTKEVATEAVTETAEEAPQNGILNPVKWVFSTNKVSDTEYDLVATANLQEGWNIYSQFTAEGGPIPTGFYFDEGKYEAVGKVKEEGKKKEGPDALFDGINVSKFVKGPVVFTQRIKTDDVSQTVKGYLEFMTCDNTQCLPPAEVDFAFNLSGDNPAIADNTPTTNKDHNFGKGTPVYQNFDHTLAASDCGNNEPEEEKSDSLFWIFLLGFGGGLIALLTPCVFPMIPLTVGFFTKSSKDRASGIRNAVTYGLSIIVIYVLLGLLITGVFGADALNLLSTNAWFNIFFGVLFIVFAISFFGYFEITLPSSWSSKTDQAADKGGLIGIFFMAFTLSLVSFSCTGPIIGTLLVETATGSGPTILGRIPVGPLMGMFGFSTALALPFALFAAFPSWLNSLPKSGGWMTSVKVTLGFIEIALALKFFSVADLTMGWKFMPYELFLAAWVLCALGLALYYLGIIRFPHDSKVSKITPKMWALSAVALAAGLYFALGFRYNPQSETFATPNMLSGLAPPAGHSYIYPKKCPQNLTCFKDFDEGLAYAKEQGKPILLDFTGHGCVNCRRMEDNVWGQDGVYELIDDNYVLISLYVDERKALDEEYMSTFSNRKMRTIGNKWADFQAIHFDRNSQPYYVLVSPESTSDKLTVLNTPKAYTPDVAEYEAFLRCGVERFAEQKKK